MILFLRSHRTSKEASQGTERVRRQEDRCKLRLLLLTQPMMILKRNFCTQKILSLLTNLKSMENAGLSEFFLCSVCGLQGLQFSVQAGKRDCVNFPLCLAVSYFQECLYCIFSQFLKCILIFISGGCIVTKCTNNKLAFLLV